MLVREFVEDESPDAYERLIDRLLASPRYGEHLAVPWLDAARYADTDGYQNDRYRYMHTWRDWVVIALNENMPFNEFLIRTIGWRSTWIRMLPNNTVIIPNSVLSGSKAKRNPACFCSRSAVGSS